MDKKTPKKRIDILLVERGLYDSREKARNAILAGIVYQNEQRIDKAGEVVHEDIKIEIRGNICPFVSRGGLKLGKAIKVFNIDLKDMTCMDIGSSTGGFTDCMLQNGAKKIYAIDVGYGQLIWSLRQDERVVVMERTNIRYLTDEQINEKMDFIATDVSFISLTKVLPIAYKFMKESAEMVCLIKPQFEAGREQVGKKGVVRDKDIHKQVIEKIINFSKDIGFSTKGLEYSPVKGPEGNIEYLLQLIKDEKTYNYNDVDNIVEESHKL